MSTDETDSRYRRIKGELLSIGFAIPGTIRETYLQCGKSWCVCARKADALHGPYYFWNRKVNGKLSSKSTPKSKLRLYQTWIDNRLKMEKLLQQLLEISQELAAALPSERVGEKSKKRRSAKRRK